MKWSKEMRVTRAMIYVRFAPESGHSEGKRGMSVNDPKRTFGVRRKWRFAAEGPGLVPARDWGLI